MGELIRKQGGDPFVAPSMRETPLENNAEAFEFAERLFHGDFDLMIFLPAWVPGRSIKCWRRVTRRRNLRRRCARSR